MNLIEVVGGKKKEREIAKEVVALCVKKLMPRMKTLDITVELQNIDALGYCLEETPREFVLSIQKGLTISDLVSTICHEMIHVKQYARRELKNVNGRTLWKKKDYTNVSYMECPWEKEAYAKEAKLAQDCFINLQFKV